jgi:pyroglutamyl-peptidase
MWLYYRDAESIIPLNILLFTQLVIHVGVSGIAKAVTIEQAAHNCGYCSPDVRDCVPEGNVCQKDGCDVIESGFEMRDVVAKINASGGGMRAEISYDPGR